MIETSTIINNRIITIYPTESQIMNKLILNNDADLIESILKMHRDIYKKNIDFQIPLVILCKSTEEINEMSKLMNNYNRKDDKRITICAYLPNTQYEENESEFQSLDTEEDQIIKTLNNLTNWHTLYYHIQSQEDVNKLYQYCQSLNNKQKYKLLITQEIEHSIKLLTFIESNIYNTENISQNTSIESINQVITQYNNKEIDNKKMENKISEIFDKINNLI